MVATVLISIFASLFIVVFVFMMCVCHLRSPGVKQAPLENKYGNVMSDIENIVEANPRITEIAVLGSHDAVSYGIEYKNSLDGLSREGLFGKTEALAKGLMYRYAVTQTVDIYTQLMQGARYFHIKVSREGGVWYGSHSILARPLAEDMEQILRFLDERKGEYVILNFQTMYTEGQPYTSLFDDIADMRYNGKNIFDYVYMSDGYLPFIGDLRYNDLTDCGEKCGAIIHNYVNNKSVGAGNSEYFNFVYVYGLYAKWHETSSKKKLKAGMDAYADYIESIPNAKDYLWVNQTQSTFSVKDFEDTMIVLFKQSLLKIAKEYNAEFVDDPSLDRYLDAMPVYLADFVTSDYGDFNNKINAKIAEHNRKTVNSLLSDAS